MSGASLIPTDSPGEHDDVADLLSIARVTWNRGDHAAAVSFVARAAQTAMELDLAMRGLELAKVAADLRATLSQIPAPPVRLASATTTPPLVLSPSPPGNSTAPAPTSAVPRPPETHPGMGLLTEADEVDVDGPHEPHEGAKLSTVPRPGSPKPPPVMSPKPPAATPSGPPRATPGQSVPPRTSAAPPRNSATPPPLPVRARQPSVHPPASITPAPSPVATTMIGQNGAAAKAASSPATSLSPTPPKTASIRPAAPAPTSGTSRAPMPLRVRSNDDVSPKPPLASLDALPPAPVPAVDPAAVRRSSPWVDEVVAPIVASGGTPVLVGIRARVQFRTDGTLELSADSETAGGLPIVILPQRGEDMTTLLKRLTRK
jgi:hypothetical protein